MDATVVDDVTLPDTDPDPGAEADRDNDPPLDALHDTLLDGVIPDTETRAELLGVGEPDTLTVQVGLTETDPVTLIDALNVAESVVENELVADDDSEAETLTEFALDKLDDTVGVGEALTVPVHVPLDDWDTDALTLDVAVMDKVTVEVDVLLVVRVDEVDPDAVADDDEVTEAVRVCVVESDVVPLDVGVSESVIVMVVVMDIVVLDVTVTDTVTVTEDVKDAVILNVGVNDTVRDGVGVVDIVGVGVAGT